MINYLKRIFKKNIKKNISAGAAGKRASAILLSFFMMTLLVLAAVGVSFLVMGDVGTVRTIVSGFQSRYAAEGITELGLRAGSENLPGYEGGFEDYSFSNSALASLDMNARGDMLPCNGADVSEPDAWLNLEENESMQLSLFAQVADEIDSYDDDIEELNDFFVEFYVGDEDGNVTETSINSDVLRWKILGLKADGQTEAISEYIPLRPDQRSDALNPSIFGPGVSNPTLTKYTYAKYYEDVGNYYVFHPAYSISAFLRSHEYNYLVLTNVVQDGSDDVIYFRLGSNTYSPVCEYVELVADASMDFGETRRKTRSFIREGENLPVFDFVLYHTDNDGSEDEGVEGQTVLQGSGFKVDELDVNKLFGL